MRMPSWLLLIVLVGGLVGTTVGCASSEEAGERADGSSASVQRAASESTPDLAPQSDKIRTVQLYRGSEEGAFPVTSLRGSTPLTLEFDLMEAEGRPLSVYFQHADRNWNRDLSASQVLESYQNDRIDNYRSSQGTDVPYVHYQYQLPNDDIRFRLSGNYILRVTERGQRDSVLFERPFFVTDQRGTLQVGGDGIRMPGQRRPSVRLAARYAPPAALRGDPFGYAVCFVRDGRLSDTRCEDRPQLAQQPQLEFELDRSRAFSPTTADYAVDLGNLRSSSKIERTDRAVSPVRVLLEPDYAQFSGREGEADLNGQIIVRGTVQGRSNPALTAEYVRTTFAFVPPRERPLSGKVVVAGSFSGMDPSRGTAMRWRPERDRYEGDRLLKQGRYQYFYATDDADLQSELQRSSPQRQSTYTTFVYYEDPSRNTDRLLQVSSMER